MGTALALRSTLVDQSSFPDFAAKARKRLSKVQPMNRSPEPVRTGPPLPLLPVFCFSGGSDGVIPRGTCHTICPVLTFTAVRRAHGGRKQGRFASVFPLASLSGALNATPGP